MIIKKTMEETKNKFKAISALFLPENRSRAGKYSSNGGTNTFRKRF